MRATSRLRLPVLLYGVADRLPVSLSGDNLRLLLNPSNFARRMFHVIPNPAVDRCLDGVLQCGRCSRGLSAVSRAGGIGHRDRLECADAVGTEAERCLENRTAWAGLLQPHRCWEQIGRA